MQRYSIADSIRMVMQVQFVDLFSNFRKVVVPDEYHSKACQFAELTWGTPPWAECAAELREMMVKTVEPIELQQTLQPIVTQACDAVFDKNAHPHKVKRFSTLSVELSSKVLPALIAKSISAAAPVVHAMLHETLAQLYKPRAASIPKAPDAVVALACSVRGCLISHLGTTLRQQDLQLPADFKLVEDAEVQTARRSLSNTLQQLTNAHSKISEIEGVMGSLSSAVGGPK